MDILLITHDPDLKEYRNRALVEKLEQAGVAVRALAPASLTFHWTRRQMVLMDRRGTTVEPRLVVNGLFRNEGEGIEVVQALEYMNYPVVNKAGGWLAAKMKPLTTIRLAQAGIPHPPTLFTLRNRSGLHRYARQQLGLPVVLKPWQGALGIGVARYRTAKGLRKRLQNYKRPVYLQRYVRHPGRDIRVLVIGDQVPAAAYRIAPKGSWKTNVYLGGTPAKCEVTPALAHLALGAARAIGLDIAGVDIIESQDRLLVIEVNAWPNYYPSDPGLRVDVARLLTAYLVRRLQKGAAG